MNSYYCIYLGTFLITYINDARSNKYQICIYVIGDLVGNNNNNIDNSISSLTKKK
jgi:hypothetical protein